MLSSVTIWPQMTTTAVLHTDKKWFHKANIYIFISFCLDLKPKIYLFIHLIINWSGTFTANDPNIQLNHKTGEIFRIKAKLFHHSCNIGLCLKHPAVILLIYFNFVVIKLAMKWWILKCLPCFILKTQD